MNLRKLAEISCQEVTFKWVMVGFGSKHLNDINCHLSVWFNVCHTLMWHLTVLTIKQPAVILTYLGAFVLHATHKLRPFSFFMYRFSNCVFKALLMKEVHHFCWVVIYTCHWLHSTVISCNVNLTIQGEHTESVGM